jgi:subtilisin family serine protease
MKSYVLPSIVSRWSFAASILAVFLVSSASALLMRDNGPEPIIVQIKESLRLSDNLDASLNTLAQLQSETGVTVEKTWAGPKLLQLVSFPKDFTEEKAVAVIHALQECDAVEKVVPVSASNLEFKPVDFVREYPSNQAIPEAARRGLDRNELMRSTRTPAQIDEAARVPHVPNQLIVRWKAKYVWKATASGFLKDIADFHGAGGARVLREMKPSPTDLTQVIEFNEGGTSMAETLRRYTNSPWVDYAQPNFLYEPAAPTPNDPFFVNPGQPNLARISGPAAWTTTTGYQNNVVAVADTGANINHPDFVAAPPLASNISPGWRNFTGGDPNDVSNPYSGHGHHVASILGAKGGNAAFMTGVAWDVKLLILKVIGGAGIGNSEWIAAATDYAWSNDGHDPAIAINMSLKTPLPVGSQLDEIVHEAVQRARAHNMVVVAAACNWESGGQDMDYGLNDNLFSPACIPTDNLIAVANTRTLPNWQGENDTLVASSNFGRYRVELGAPGGDDDPNYGIVGLTPDPNSVPGWIRMTGTSMATPHVTGAIQLVKSVYPWEDYWGLKDRVLMGVDDVPLLFPNGQTAVRTGGRLNLAKALHKRTLIKNWSTRAKVESGDRIVIGGFTIGGSPGVLLKVVIRGLGPSLPVLGVPRLNDPKLQLNNSLGGFISSNLDWGSLSQSDKTDLANAGLTPSNVHEAAIVATLVPGSYTVLMQSQDGQQGVGLFELYELRGLTTEQNRIKNVSARCPVGVGDENAIAGTLVQNSDTKGSLPKRRLLIIGRGPSLPVTGTLPNPYLELRNGAGALISSNDQWQEIDFMSTGLEQKLVEPSSGFFPPPKADEQYLNESALWPTLSPGSYTAILRDSGGANGIGLIEFYEY